MWYGILFIIICSIIVNCIKPVAWLVVQIWAMIYVPKSINGFKKDSLALDLNKDVCRIIRIVSRESATIERLSDNYIFFIDISNLKHYSPKNKPEYLNNEI